MFHFHLIRMCGELHVLLVLVIGKLCGKVQCIQSNSSSVCEDVESQSCQDLVRKKPSLCREECMQNLCRRSCGHCPTNRCFWCDAIVNPRMCNKTKECAANEFCIITETLSSEFRKVYQLGCSSEQFCISLYGTSPSPPYDVLIGRKKKEISFQGKCCNGDLCNALDDHENYNTHPLTTPSNESARQDDVSASACALLTSHDRDLCKNICFSTNICPKTCNTFCSYDSHCPPGYFTLDVNGQIKCYHISVHGRNWKESENYCSISGEGSQCVGLAQIKSKEENRALFDYIEHHKHDLHVHSGTLFWMDAITNDSNIQEVHEDSLNWVWSENGESLSYFYLQDNALNHEGPSHPERALAFGPDLGEGQNGYYWNGKHCENRYKALCEYYIH